MMKTRNNFFKYINSWILAGLVVITAGCTDGFDSLNTPSDQIDAEDVDASNLGQAFAHAQFHAMRGQPGGGGFQIGQNLFGDLYAQYFATTAEQFESDQHVNVGNWVNVAWNYFYSNPAPQIFFVEQFTEEEGMNVENAVAKVWKVQAYHRMTDYWGPIIYSAFGNGETTVPYDTQEEVYKSFFQTLDEAVAVLEQNSGRNAFGTNDQVYGGDVDQWLLFANSLRLRLAIRVRYADPALAQQEAEKAVAAGVMTSNTDNANVLTTSNSRNPLDTITAWREFRMSSAMQSTLEGFNDPRLPEYFNPNETDGEYRGMRNGLPTAEKGPNLNAEYSDMESKWLSGGDNPPMRVMSAAEVYFLRAEGALAGWNMEGNAKELYEEGIRTSMMERTGVSAGDIEAYISSSNTPVALNDIWNTPAMSDIPVAFEEGGSTERQLEQIITQKWLALYPDGIEGWAERRRTGYPKGYPVINSLNPHVDEDELMRRLKFADDEFSNNGLAVQEAINMLNGPNENDTRLWWDAKP